jgi:hypothetical protein
MRDSIFRALSMVAVFAALGAVGCGGNTANQAVDEVLKQSGKSRNEVFPLAGKITIDGHEPELRPGARLFVMLHDRDSLDARKGPAFKTSCQPNGEFSFNTYLQGDGVPPGKYVITIAQLHQGFRQGYIGPDGLKNLYNDPEVNSKLPEFVIDHTRPGETNCSFDLQVVGRDAAKPGSHAVTKLRP